jgi:hypothetical protein
MCHELDQSNEINQMIMGKRQRSVDPLWWEELVQEIFSGSKGFVHSSLEFNSSSRELTVNEDIPPGTLLLRIPRKSLISLENASFENLWFRKAKVSLDQSKLHFPVADLLIAFSLASQTPTYLKTLPTSSAWDALPRRWSDEKLEENLKGSPLLSRVKRDKLGAQSDFEQLCKLWEEDEKPKFSAFDDMLAAVSSRAFADSLDQIVMIPILDLCNHCRGDKYEKKNLAYRALEQDGSIEVTACQTINQYDGLRLTYGAQGNGQLLSNYGFAISDNLEPDGSSNDQLEFRCFDGSNTINLRTGPKAYTYGALVKALEQTIEKDHGFGLANNEKDDEDDDIEAFLDECDPLQEIDIYCEATIEEEEDEKESENGAIQEEVEALKHLRKILQQRIDAYYCKGKVMKERLKLMGSTGYYCALLIHSEQRCLYFYYRACQKIESLLLGRGTEEVRKLESTSSLSSLDFDGNDLKLIEEQTTSLANTYMKIRHENMF